MTITYSKQALKTIMLMDKKTKQRIKAAIESLPAGDIKPLQGYNGYFRLRVGGWRIIFTYPDKDKLMIAKVAPRGGAYKGGM